MADQESIDELIERLDHLEQETTAGRFNFQTYRYELDMAYPRLRRLRAVVQEAARWHREAADFIRKSGKSEFGATHMDTHGRLADLLERALKERE